MDELQLNCVAFTPALYLIKARLFITDKYVGVVFPLGNGQMCEEFIPPCADSNPSPRSPSRQVAAVISRKIIQ